MPDLQTITLNKLKARIRELEAKLISERTRHNGVVYRLQKQIRDSNDEAQNAMIQLKRLTDMIQKRSSRASTKGE